MSLYSLSQRTTATTTNNPSWEIRSGAANKPRLLELAIVQVTTGVTGVYGLGKPGSIGVTPTSPQTFVTESDAGAPAAQTTACVAWGTAPTAPTTFVRKLDANSLIGTGIIWSFPKGLDIPVSSSLVVWIIQTGPVCDVWAVIDE